MAAQEQQGEGVVGGRFPEWLVFLPVALGIGLVSGGPGVHASGWMVTGLAAVAGGLLVASALRGRGSQASDAAS